MHTTHALHALHPAPAKPGTLTDEDLSRIIEMAWEDRTPFESIALQFGLSEGDVITLMRRQLKPGSYRMWRQRVTGRATKHFALRSPAVNRAFCPTQYKHR
ncbi:MAG: TIGR03643 family protein [Gammaproteobacteria bacterium]|nr:TIGR03643 family protein [Gammaproteobacteria bacterium]MBU0889673.1 TIGR03643 family protein [Gammaproteobacteria bacterium]